MGYNHFRYARRIDADNIGIFHEDLTKILHLNKGTANRSILKGGLAGGDQLFIYPNATDTHPRIQMYGTTDISMYFATTTGFACLNSDGTYLQFKYPSAIPTIETLITDKDIQIKPNGVGKVRFGAYSAGVAGDSTGYIPIKDEAGNARKLMVQA